MQAVRLLREVLPESVLILILAEHDGEEGLNEMLQFRHTDILSKPFFVSAFQKKLETMWMDIEEETHLDHEKTGILEGMRFLAAEDNEINAEILTEILGIEGAFCEIVENGRLAVERFEKAEQGEFDAILMDVQMPVMNGHDATRAIRSMEREDARRIPIIAMTANAFAEDEKAALDAGMDAHVAKPLDVELLKKVIKHCVERKENYEKG